jgi:hypothetical protein
MPKITRTGGATVNGTGSGAAPDVLARGRRLTIFDGAIVWPVTGCPSSP